MREFMRPCLLSVGLSLLVVGSALLLLITLAAAVGLWPDTSPRPVGPGLLFFVTFWPSVVSPAMGIAQVRHP